MSKFLYLVLQIFFALFWLSVAAYAIRRTAALFFASGRQATILTVTVLAAFVLGCAVNPSFGVTPLGVSMLRGGRLADLPSVFGRVSPCAALRAKNAIALLGRIDTATMDDGKVAYTLLSGADVPTRDTIDMRGWLAFSERLRPAAGVCLLVDGLPSGIAKTYYGISRPDVAASMTAPQLDGSGFDVRFAVSSLKPGRHRLELGAFDTRRESVATMRDFYTIDVQAK